MEKTSKVKAIEAFKPHKGRVWHGIAERIKNGGVVLYCKPSRITIDSWAEYSDDYVRCKEAGWKICTGCDRAITDIEFHGN